MAKRNAFFFNGRGSHIVLDAASRLALTDHDFTVEAWVKVEDWGAGGDLTILGTDQTGDQIGLHLAIRDRKPLMGFYNNDTAGQTELAAGLWYHLAWRYHRQRREQALFVNGVLDATGTDKTPFLGRGTVVVGRWGGSSYFHGQIIDLRLWSIARPSHEILRDLHRQLRGDEPGLSSYWRLDREPDEEGRLHSARAEPVASYSGQPAVTSIAALRHEHSGSLHLDGQDGHVVFELAFPEGDATHELWFRTEQRDCGIFSLMESEDGSQDCHLFLKGGNLRARLADEEVGIEGQQLADGHWHSIAHVFDATAGDQRLYVDGMPLAQGSADFSRRAGLRFGVAGYSLAAARTHFEGELAELRIWSRARRQEEIQRDMNLRLGGGERDLLGLWPLTRPGTEASPDNPSTGFGTAAPNLVARVTEVEDGSHGQLRGGVRFIDEGPAWEGQHTLVLDGAGAVEIAGEPGVRFEAHTLEAWVLPRKGPLGANGLPLWVGRGHSLRLFADGTLNHVFASVDSADRVLEPAGRLGWDRWNHLAVVYDGVQLQTFIDGKLETEVAAAVDPWDRFVRLEVDRAANASVAVLFDDADFQGPSLELTGGRYDLAALRAGGFCDDCLSSLRVAPGWRVTIHEHGDFSGWSESFIEDTPYVGDELNDQTSSVTVEWIGEAPVIVWKKIGAVGEPQPLLEGPHESDVLVVDGVGPRSLRVFPGWQARIFEGGGKPLELSPQGLKPLNRDLAAPLVTLGGRRDGTDPVGLRGRLADVRLWSIARSAEDLARDRHRRLLGSEQGLVGWWPLAESSDQQIAERAFDLSGNHRHGKVSNGRRGVPPAPFRHAVRLDGQSWIEIASSPELSLADGEGTLEVWYRPDREQGNEDSHVLIEKWAGSRGFPYSVHYLSDSGTARAERSNGASPHPSITSGRALDDDAFHHVAFARRLRGEESEIVLYVDGIEEGTATDTTGRVHNPAPLYLGCRAGAEHFLTGELTELRLWDRALNEAELLAHQNRRIRGDEAGLVGYWPLAEESAEQPVAGRIGLSGQSEQTRLEVVDLPLLSDKSRRVLTAPAARFDGVTSRVVVSPEPTFQLTGPMTVEVWVRPGRGGELRQQPVLEHCGPDSGWALRCSHERASFRITVDGKPVEVISPLDLGDASAWIHLTGLYDGETIQLLVNGTRSGLAQRKVSGVLTPADPDLEFHFGSHPDRSDRFAGDVAEVRLWHRARRLEEIHRDLFQRLPRMRNGDQHPGLVGYWKLDGQQAGEGGTLVADASGHDHHGQAEAVDWIDVELPPRLKAAPAIAWEPEDRIAALRAELTQIKQERDTAHKELGTLDEKVRVLEGRNKELQGDIDREKKALEQRLEGEIEQKNAEFAELKAKSQEWKQGRFAIEDVYANAIEQVEQARQKIGAGEGAYRLGKVDVELRYVAQDGGSTAVFPKVDEKVDSTRFTTHRIELTPQPPAEAPKPRRWKVPNLLGSTEILARRKLTESGFLAEVHYRAVGRAQAGELDWQGRVVEQIPRPDEEVAPHSPVMIFLGKVSRPMEVDR